MGVVIGWRPGGGLSHGVGKRMNAGERAGGELLMFGLLAFGAYLFIKKMAPQIADSLNPASTNNFAYRGANALMQILTGDPNTSVGSKAYDVAVAVGMAPDWGAIAAADTVIDQARGRVMFVTPGTNKVIAETVLGDSGNTYYYPDTTTPMPGQANVGGGTPPGVGGFVAPSGDDPLGSGGGIAW